MLATGKVDYVKILRESLERKQRRRYYEILSEIERWPYDPNLTAFATYKLLRLGTRTRRRSELLWTDDQLTRRLIKKYPLSKEDARVEIEKWKRGEAEWIEHVFNDPTKRDSITRGGENQCCISKIKGFHISRSMATYWRHHPDLQECMTDIYRLLPRQQDGAYAAN